MNSYFEGNWLVLGGISLMIGALLGIAMNNWLIRRADRERRRIPKRWPLRARLVASSEESKVWRWLAGAFYDHSVMIKMPVTRFTLPRTTEQGAYWYEMLSSVYCTFTVVGVDGRVVGCVDVPNAQRIARGNRVLKETLLNQCGIAYLVIESVRLPSLQDIRFEFLGEMASMTRGHERDEASIRAASTSLRASLMQQRQTRASDLAPLTPISQKPPRGKRSAGHSVMPSQFPSDFNENSFLIPLDSRNAELR